MRNALTSDAPRDADPRIERVARLVAVIASLWFVLANTWEIAGPFAAGHWAAAASVGTAAENMWTWHIIAPVLVQTTDVPPPSLYYCNHPWGIFWFEAIVVKLFGHHDWVCRLPAVLWSSLTPPLLYGVGRGIWGPVAGAIAAASFVVVPIALAFGNFNALEVPVIFGVLLASWGYVRLTKTWRRRWVLVSTFGLLQAMNSDWAAYFFAAPLLAFMLPRGIFLDGRWYPPIDRLRFSQWWALLASTAVGLILFYAWQFGRYDALSSLLHQGVRRSAGTEAPLSEVLAARADWIETAFTPLAIFLGKAIAPLLLFRLIFLKRDLEIIPLAFLSMATIQYVVFKQGADIHFFWPHYFAAYFALAMASATGSIEDFARFVARLFHRRGQLVPPIIALAIGIVVPITMIPDGVRGLKYSRGTGGRFDERGDLIQQDIDKSTVLGWLRPQLESRTSVQLHEGMKPSWSFDWILRRPTGLAGIPTTARSGEAQYYLADSRFIYASDVQRLVAAFHVRAVGPFYVVDRAEPKAPIDGYSLAERQPSFLEWYFLQGNDPIYSVRPDPFVTWELRHHFGQTPNPPPTAEPTSFEQRRIAHNLAVANGDGAMAERLLRALVADLDVTAAREYPDGTRLLGTRLTQGVVDKLSVYFEAAHPIDPDAAFNIVTEVSAAARWSLVDAATRHRAVGMPFDIPTPLWKEKMIYSATTDIRPRPGTERYLGMWGPRRGVPPLPAPPSDSVLLLTTGK